MNGPARDYDAAVERYLDGSMPEGERAAFERAADADPAVRAAIELQRSIDASLRRGFAPTAGAAEAPAEEPPRPAWRDWLLYAAAAAVLLVAGVVMVPRLLPDPPPLASAYRAEVEGGFVPREACTTDAEFSAWLEHNYGQALRPNPRGGVEFLGWSYRPVVTTYSGVLLARVDGDEVIVVIDRAEHERVEHERAGWGMRVFRRVIGDLVAYEVTPREQPAIVDRLSLEPGSEAPR